MYVCIDMDTKRISVPIYALARMYIAIFINRYSKIKLFRHYLYHIKTTISLNKYMRQLYLQPQDSYTLCKPRHGNAVVQDMICAIENSSSIKQLVKQSKNLTTEASRHVESIDEKSGWRSLSYLILSEGSERFINM